MGTRDDYLARFSRVVAYVDAHVHTDADLTVERLSGVAAFSKFHFHRQWAALYELGVGEYVQLVRFERAAQALAFRPARTILALALEAGYESPEAFARAFKKRLGQTPSEFRRQPDWFAWNAATKKMHDIRSHAMTTSPRPLVEIASFPETRVAVLEHRGDPRTLGNTIRRFISWRQENQLPPRLSATYNILYGDPEATPPEEFRLDLCAATRGGVADNAAGVVERTIPGGRCAVLRHTGSDDGLGANLGFLYREWLPQSGHEPRDYPPFLQRVRSFPDVPEAEAITDIFLPLK